MRASVTSGSAFNGLGLVGAGLMGVFPQYRWIGAIVIGIGSAFVVFDIRFERGQIAIGGARPFRERVLRMWPQLLIGVSLIGLIVGLFALVKQSKAVPHTLHDGGEQLKSPDTTPAAKPSDTAPALPQKARKATTSAIRSPPLVQALDRTSLPILEVVVEPKYGLLLLNVAPIIGDRTPRWDIGVRVTGARIAPYDRNAPESAQGPLAFSSELKTAGLLDTRNGVDTPILSWLKPIRSASYFANGRAKVRLTLTSPNGQSFALEQPIKPINFGQSAISSRVANPLEAKRREAEVAKAGNFVDRLRTEYIMSHDGISAEMAAGTAPLPDDWVNERLARSGFAVRYKGLPGGGYTLALIPHPGG